jgi:hypothetical protein
MLKKETIEKLKAFFDIDKLIAAIKAPAEVDFEVPEGTLMTEDVLTTRDKTMREEGVKEGTKVGFKDGKDKGLEIAGTVILKKFNIDPKTAGINPADPDKITEAIHASAAKGDAGLQEQVGLLMKDKQKLEADLEQEKQSHNAAKFDSTLITNMPVNRSGQIMSDEEYLLTIKANLKFENVDGIMVVKRGEEVMRDPTTKAPLPLKKALETYFADRKWIAVEQKSPEGGRGGKDALPQGGNTGGVRTFNQAAEQYKKEKNTDNIISPEFTAYVQNIAKDVPEFDWNK